MVSTSPVLVFLRLRRWQAGAVWVAIGALAAAATAEHPVPVPLNLVGARAATAVLIAAMVTLPWVLGLSNDVPEVEVGAARLRPMRLLLVSCTVCWLGLVWVGWSVAGGSVVATRFAAACALFVGLGAAASALPRSFPRWLPNVLVVLALFVFGIDRSQQVPRGWAWLLEPSTVGAAPTSVLVPLAVLASGCLVLVVRRPRTGAE